MDFFEQLLEKLLRKKTFAESANPINVWPRNLDHLWKLN